MSNRIANNIDAMNAYRNLDSVQGKFSKSMEKLSSGYRINRAADDAAGLVLSENLRGQIGALKTASKNAQDAVSLVQAREGALNEISAMLQRQNELAVAFTNGIQNPEAQAALQTEFDEITTEIDRVQATAKFNGILMFGGATATFQVGGDNTDVIDVDLTSTVDTSALDITDNLTVTQAINDTATLRANDGIVQNRLEHVVNSLNVSVENHAAAESRIRDTDMAAEMVNFSKQSILSQAGTAMLAQANQASQGVLSLLR